MQARRNAFTLLMEEAGKHVCPEKVDIVCKYNKQKLFNDVIDFLLKNKLGWTKDSVLSQGKSFASQLEDILWQLDGHHEKLAAQSCAIPEMFSRFQNYNIVLFQLIVLVIHWLYLLYLQKTYRLHQYLTLCCRYIVL